MILANVDDRRRQWVGAWEVESLDYAKLTAADIGRTVIYVDRGGIREAGTLSSWRDSLVFARYSAGDTAAGVGSWKLVFGVKPLDGPEVP